MTEERLVTRPPDHLVLGFEDSVGHECSLSSGPKGFHLRVASKLSFAYMPEQPSFAFSTDPFSLLPEKYWPLVMDFVLEVATSHPHHLTV